MNTFQQIMASIKVLTTMKIITFFIENFKQIRKELSREN